MRINSSSPIRSSEAGRPWATCLKNWLGLFLALAFLSAVNASARQRELRHESSGDERRIALVIGNSAYTVGPLKNPVNDARAMTQALREVGFEVIHREDLKREDMRRAIREFGARIGRGGVGLFYYAGHGVQVRGENYLIPVDARPESADEVDDDGVNATYVLEKMESAGNGMNIVILDACRNNPFTRSFRSGSDGLASVHAPTGTLIAYATAPGAVASDGGDSGNGVYTQELLKIIRTPGLGIEEVFKRVRVAVRRRTQGRQTPWEASSLEGDFYFSERRRPGASPAPPAEVADVERNDWEKVKDSVDPKDFEAFLKKYPRGKFSRQATDALAPLAGMAEPAGPKVNQPAGRISPAEVADGMPFMVYHNHLFGMVGGRLLVSPNGLEYKEAKGGKQEDAFSVPCGRFVMSRDNGNLWRGSSSFNIKLPGGKEINIGMWSGEEEEMVRQAIDAFCERRLPDYLKTGEGGRPSTSPRGIFRFDGFQVNVAYRHRERLAEAVRIANRLNSLGAFAGVSKLDIPEGDKHKLAMMSGAPEGFYVRNFDPSGAKAILFYHDDLEGVARNIAQELYDRVGVVTRKTGHGKRHEFYLWLL